MALNINGTTGISGVDGSVSAPAVTGTDSNTGINFGSDTVNINTGGSTRATIDSSGTIQVKGDGGNNNKIYGYDGSSLAWILGCNNSDDAEFNNFRNSNLLFKTNGSERMRIDSAGALLINNAVTTYPWSATGDVAHGVLLNSRASNVEFPISGNSNNTLTCILNRTNGNGRILEFKYNGSVVGNVDSNGSSLPSDRDFKTNISDLNLGLSVVNKLKPSQFNYKIDDANTPVMYGLIAQDLEETLTSEGVTKNSTQLIQHHPTDDSESNYSVDYLKLLPILINSIKELSTEVVTLKTKVAALEAG